MTETVWRRVPSADHVITFERETEGSFDKLVFFKRDYAVSLSSRDKEDSRVGLVAGCDLGDLRRVLDAIEAEWTGETPQERFEARVGEVLANVSSEQADELAAMFRQWRQNADNDAVDWAHNERLARLLWQVVADAAQGVDNGR